MKKSHLYFIYYYYLVLSRDILNSGSRKGQMIRDGLGNKIRLSDINTVTKARPLIDSCSQDDAGVCAGVCEALISCGLCESHRHSTHTLVLTARERHTH